MGFFGFLSGEQSLTGHHSRDYRAGDGAAGIQILLPHDQLDWTMNRMMAAWLGLADGFFDDVGGGRSIDAS